MNRCLADPNRPGGQTVGLRLFLGIALGLGGLPGVAADAQDHHADPLNRGITFLMSQLSSDGLWHSPNYGNLKDGAAISAFVLYALQDLPSPDSDRLQVAVDHLVQQLDPRGFVTNPEGPDYSNYASAMLLLACDTNNLKLPEPTRQALVQYLVRAQLNEEEGFSSQDPDYGGWDLSGWMDGRRPTTGTNVSVTAVVVEALSRYRSNATSQAAPMRHQPQVDACLQRSLSWTARVQNRSGDGGFHFHPQQTHDGNKAAWADGDLREQTRSYGTATADGLRILIALGKPAQDPHVQQAVQWLQRHPVLDKVPGFSHETGDASWAYGLRFYYYQALSQSLDCFPEDEARQIAREIQRILSAEQSEDGSWTNTNTRMREDDPLIATGFAVTALKNCQKWLP